MRQWTESERERRAAARDLYNLVRKAHAARRRKRVAELLTQGYKQAEIAGLVGVHRSTISRDVKTLHLQARRENRCPVCGRLMES
jgi:DNA-binding NarL/FixJ family response regulator